jgi:hypothetical protein
MRYTPVMRVIQTGPAAEVRSAIASCCDAEPRMLRMRDRMTKTVVRTKALVTETRSLLAQIDAVLDAHPWCRRRAVVRRKSESAT